MQRMNERTNERTAAQGVLEELLRPRRQQGAAHRAGLADAGRPQLLHARGVVHVVARQGLHLAEREGLQADRAVVAAVVLAVELLGRRRSRRRAAHAPRPNLASVAL